MKRIRKKEKGEIEIEKGHEKKTGIKKTQERSNI